MDEAIQGEATERSLQQTAFAENSIYLVSAGAGLAAGAAVAEVFFSDDVRAGFEVDDDILALRRERNQMTGIMTFLVDSEGNIGDSEAIVGDRIEDIDAEVAQLQYKKDEIDPVPDMLGLAGSLLAGAIFVPAAIHIYRKRRRA